MHHCKYLPLTGNYKETRWLYYNYNFFCASEKEPEGVKVIPRYLLLGLAGFLT